MKAIMEAIERLSKTHPEHISQYGTGASVGNVPSLSQKLWHSVVGLQVNVAC